MGLGGTQLETNWAILCWWWPCQRSFILTTVTDSLILQHLSWTQGGSRRLHDIISSGEWCAFTAHSKSSLKWTFQQHCVMCAPLTIKAPNEVSGPDNHTPQQQLNQNVIMSRSICCHHTIPLLFLHNGLLSPHSQSLPLLSVSLSCQKQTKHYCEGNMLLFLCCFCADFIKWCQAHGKISDAKQCDVLEPSNGGNMSRR